MSRERIRKWRTAGAALRLGLHVCALVVLTPPAVATAAVSEPETVFAETDVIAGPGITDWTFGDPLGAGRQDLLVARGNRIEVYAQSGAGTYEPVHTFALPHAAPAIAAADVNHDAVDEILVGTSGAGSIRIYSVTPSGGAVRVGDTRYTWATVRAVRTGDVDGDGWTDVAALNQEGVGTLFRWTVSGWEQVWREPATAGPAVSFLDLTDMDGDGRAELVVARANGYVGVWRWTGTGMAPAWENYPWGNPFAVGLVDIDADGQSDLLLTTDQNILYGFGWQGGHVVQKLHLPTAEFAPWFSGAGTAGTIHPELFGLNGFELSVWQLVAPTGPPRRVWELSLPWRSVRISAAPFGTVFVLSADGELHLLRRVDRDHLIVRAGGLTVPLEHPTLYRGGVPYLSAADWAKLLGLSLHPSQGGRRLVIWRGERFLLVTPGDDRALLNGRRTTLGAAALEMRGLVYLPLGITQLFAEPVRWDPLHRSIDLPRPLPGAMLLP